MSDTSIEQPQELAPEGEQAVEVDPTVDTGTEPAVDPEPQYDYLDLNDETASKYVKVKVDGEELDVPLSEALNGYQRQEAFTRRTQEVAEQRKQAEQALQLQQALQASPGLTMQILAEQAGMTVHDFLGLTPAQQNAVAQNAEEPEYEDPLERAIAEERQARQSLEQRLAQRDADEVLQRHISGLKQQFQIEDSEVREVVAAAMKMQLPPAMFPMIYQSMAYQRANVQNQTRQQDQAARQQADEQRQAAAAAAGQVVSTGSGAVGVTGTPANQEYSTYREAIEAAFNHHGDVS